MIFSAKSCCQVLLPSPVPASPFPASPVPASPVPASPVPANPVPTSPGKQPRPQLSDASFIGQAVNSGPGASRDRRSAPHVNAQSSTTNRLSIGRIGVDTLPSGILFRFLRRSGRRFSLIAMSVRYYQSTAPSPKSQCYQELRIGAFDLDSARDNISEDAALATKCPPMDSQPICIRQCRFGLDILACLGAVDPERSAPVRGSW